MRKPGSEGAPSAEDLKNSRVKEEVEQLEEGRQSQRHPLEGHEYHKKSDEALVHIAKDAHKAAEAMKSHNTTAENKYRDQANDSATVRYYRQKNGMADWYKKKYGHIKEEVVAEGTDPNTQSHADAFKSETDTMKPNTKKYVGRKGGKEVHAKKDAQGNVKFYHRDGIKGPLKGVAEGAKSPGVGWMLKADPKLGEKVKAKKEKYKEFKQNVGKKTTPMKEEIVTEMDKSQTPPGRDGGNDDASKKEYATKITTPKKVVKDGEKMLNKILKPKEEMKEEVKDEYARKVDKYLKKKHGKDDSQKKLPMGAGFAAARRKARLASNGRMDEALSPAIRMQMALQKAREDRERSERNGEAALAGKFSSGPAKQPTKNHTLVSPKNEEVIVEDDVINKVPKVPFDEPTKKAIGKVKDKSGAVHTPMSRTRDIARTAARRQAGIKEAADVNDPLDRIDTSAKRSLSRTAGMVKDLATNAKAKAKSKDKKDTFEAEPELSSQIMKQD